MCNNSRKLHILLTALNFIYLADDFNRNVRLYLLKKRCILKKYIDP